MKELITKNCSPIPENESALKKKSISTLLQQLDPQWHLNDDNKSISCSYKFKNYYQTMAFINVIVQIAHQQDHHPDISFGYNNCTVNYSTHSLDGLSINDFICAAKTNAAQKL